MIVVIPSLLRLRPGLLVTELGGGGIALCFRADAKASEEEVMCELMAANHNKIIINYLALRPTSGEINKSIDRMSVVLRSVMMNVNEGCFLGDFNMSNIDWKTWSYNCTANNAFCNMINQNNLIQLNNII